MADDKKTAIGTGGGGVPLTPTGGMPRVSSRVPAVIEGHAEEISPTEHASSAPNPPPESQVASVDTVSFEAADAPLEHETPHVSPPDGPVLDTPMPVEPPVTLDGTTTATGSGPGSLSGPEAPTRRPRRGWLLALLLLLVGGGAAAWYAIGQDNDMVAGLRRMAMGEPAPALTAKAPGTTATSGPAATRSPPSTNSTTPPVVVMPVQPNPETASARRAETPATPPVANPQATLGANSAASRPSERSSPPVAQRNDATSPTPVVATPASSPVSDARLADLDRRLSDLDGRLTALSGAPAKPAAETTAALGAQAGRLGRIEETLSAIDKRLAGVEAQLATPKTDVRAAQAPDVAMRDTENATARLLVSQTLLGGVSAGRSFASEVAALRSLGSDDASLKRLAPSADAGVPTLAALRDGFAAARPKSRAAVATVDPEARWDQRMLARLSSLVSIRSVDDRGPSPEAIASRIEAALGRNDLPAALSLTRELPAADQEALKGWTRDLARRLDAEEAARGLITAALTALAKPRS